MMLESYINTRRALIRRYREHLQSINDLQKRCKAIKREINEVTDIIYRLSPERSKSIDSESEEVS